MIGVLIVSESLCQNLIGIDEGNYILIFLSSYATL